ncbi:MAG: hypothetical protein QUS35_12590 [bacterium]|nr:hypothetical protein [bacterium]
MDSFLHLVELIGGRGGPGGFAAAETRRQTRTDDARRFLFNTTGPRTGEKEAAALIRKAAA